MSEEFTSVLICWHEKHRRKLPWKKYKDPYTIWLSEIILQQTRIEQGVPYFSKFKKKYPTIFDLANADLQDIIKNWEGLGYYNRARNLHITARQIVAERNGFFPTNYEELSQLKGVGPYSAAAIASFCFNKRIAAIDGNGYRVLSRYFGIQTPIHSSKGKKEFQALGNKLIATAQPATFNQALMDFGALVCLPKSPICANCPLVKHCVAKKSESVMKYPVKRTKQTVKNRFFNYFLIETPKGVLVEERREKDIWKNLYQLPLIETSKPMTWARLSKKDSFKQIFYEEQPEKPITYKEEQVLSHQKIVATIYQMALLHPNQHKKYLPISKNNLTSLPFPKLLNGFFSKKIFTLEF